MQSASVSLNGISMYYERHGEGEPLLLLHGFSGCAADWKPFLGRFGGGREFIVPELRGHGHSTGEDVPFTFRQAALDVCELLEHLGIRRCDALGVSGGAKTLLHVATQQPSRLRRMVLVSAAPYFPAQARSLMTQYSEGAHTEEEWQLMRSRHPRGEEQIRALWAQPKHFANNTEDMSFTPARLATITAETLIVHGDRDPFYPVELAVEMYRAIPKSALWVVPNGGHGPIAGAMAEPFAAALKTFLG